MKMLYYCIEYSVLFSLSDGKNRLFLSLSGANKRLSGGWGQPFLTSVGRTLFT